MSVKAGTKKCGRHGIPSLGAGFDAQRSAAFSRPVREAIIAPEDNARDVAAVAEALAHHYNPDVFERIIDTESHDDVANGKARIPEQVHPGRADSWESKERDGMPCAGNIVIAPYSALVFSQNP